MLAIGPCLRNDHMNLWSKVIADKWFKGGWVRTLLRLLLLLLLLINMAGRFYSTLLFDERKKKKKKKRKLHLNNMKKILFLWMRSLLRASTELLCMYRKTVLSPWVFCPALLCKCISEIPIFFYNIFPHLKNIIVKDKYPYEENYKGLDMISPITSRLRKALTLCNPT